MENPPLEMTEKSREATSQNSPPINDEDKCRPRKLPQYIASIAATIGALAFGLVVGWTSPAGDNGRRLDYPFDIGVSEFSWVSSVLHLGAAAISIPIGILTNVVGRRRIMLVIVIPFTIGWACVIWPNCIATLIFGRFILGICGGSFIVLAPMYIAEVADKETRGRLSSYFELLYCTGVLIVYTLGLFENMFALSLICATLPIIFTIIFFFMPETPTYYLLKGNVEAARESLIWLRGRKYNVEAELNEGIEGRARRKNGQGVSFFVAIRSKAAINGLIIGYGLMFFQQFTGINAILAYASSILAKDRDDNTVWPAIVVGAIQATAVFIATLVVDNWGRRVLLIMSGIVMCLTTLILGSYFYFDQDDSMNDFKWLPLACICGFVIFSSFGFGPIPVTMANELFSPQIKGVASSGCVLVNRLLAFTVTKCYSDIEAAVGRHGTFWIFSIIAALSVVFVIFVVPETKGKSLEEIQIQLGGEDDVNKKLEETRS